MARLYIKHKFLSHKILNESLVNYFDKYEKVPFFCQFLYLWNGKVIAILPRLGKKDLCISKLLVHIIRVEGIKEKRKKAVKLFSLLCNQRSKAVNSVFTLLMHILYVALFFILLCLVFLPLFLPFSMLCMIYNLQTIFLPHVLVQHSLL